MFLGMLQAYMIIITPSKSNMDTENKMELAIFEAGDTFSMAHHF